MILLLVRPRCANVAGCHFVGLIYQKYDSGMHVIRVSFHDGIDFKSYNIKFKVFELNEDVYKCIYVKYSSTNS